MSDLSRDDWYGRALSVHTGLGSGTVLQCLYRLENWSWLESRLEDREVATRDGAAALLPADRSRAAGGDGAARGAVQGAAAVRAVRGVWEGPGRSEAPDLPSLPALLLTASASFRSGWILCWLGGEQP
jgi:hypothetical protein